MATPQERTFNVSPGSAVEAEKDPDEILDYTLDWSDRLNDSEHIEASAWVYPAGWDNELTVAYGLQPFTTKTTTIWFEDGRLGATYTLTNRVTTDEDRVLDQTFKLKIVTR